MGWMEKLVTALGKVSFSSIHGGLNGYGTAIVRIRFQEHRYLPQIMEAVQGIGWDVDDSNWVPSSEVTLIRSGSAVAGKQTELARELAIALAPVPNEILLLEPKVTRVDYARLPKWNTLQPADAAHPETAVPEVVFGSNPGSVLPPQYTVTPVSGAAKILDGKPLWTWPPNWKLVGKTVAALVVTGVALGFGAAISLWVQAENLTETARTIPVLAMLYWTKDLFPLGFWLSLGGYGVALAILSTTVVGLAHLFRRVSARVRTSLDRDKLNEEPAPKVSPRQGRGSDSSKPSRKPWSPVRSRVTKVGVFLFTAGLGYAIPPFCNYSVDLWEGTGPDNVGYLVLTVATFGALAIVVGLWSAARKMTVRRSPRLAINLGAFVGIAALLLRAPTWAYADGLGAAWLSDSVDWTSQLSLSTQFMGYVLLASVYVAFLLWFLRVAPSMVKHLFGIPVVVIILLQGFIVLGPAWQAGRSLGETGTAANARGNYPAAACLEPARTGQGTKLSRYGGPPAAVWVLGTKDGRLIVTDRAEGPRPLDRPGRVTSLPAADYVVQMVRYSSDDDPAKYKCAQK